MDTSTSRSIMNYFSSIPDPRMILKTRHKLTEIITIALCAVIAGADDWVEISDFGEAKKEWFKISGEESHQQFYRFRDTDGVLDAPGAASYTLRAEQQRAFLVAQAGLHDKAAEFDLLARVLLAGFGG